MNVRTVLFGIGLASAVGGCVGNTTIPPVGPDHPANPDAAAAPVPAPSQTLAIEGTADKEVGK